MCATFIFLTFWAYCIVSHPRVDLPKQGVPHTKTAPASQFNFQSRSTVAWRSLMNSVWRSTVWRLGSMTHRRFAAGACNNTERFWVDREPAAALKGLSDGTKGPESLSRDPTRMWTLPLGGDHLAQIHPSTERPGHASSRVRYQCDVT